MTPLSVLLPAPFKGRALGSYVAKTGTDSIVAFAGFEPEQLQDWLRNFAFVPNGDGVHSGFAAGVDSIISELTTVTAAAPDATWFTGHSLAVSSKETSSPTEYVMRNSRWFASPNAC